jgi:hypothetical protein
MLGLILPTGFVSGYIAVAEEVTDQPPRSLGLIPNGFHLFGPLKKHLAGKWFASDINMKQAVISWLQTRDVDFFCAGMQALVSQWAKCLNVSGGGL